MSNKKKKDMLFGLGIVIGIAVGAAIHRLGLGVAFGVMIGLAMREVYDRRYNNRL